MEREVNRGRAEGSERLYVLDERTLERPWGWVMYYGGLGRAAPANHPPYIVNRVTGELVAVGSAWPVQKYLDDYETRLLAVTRPS